MTPLAPPAKNAPRRIVPAAVAATFASAALFAASAAAGYEFRTAVLSGETAPDAGQPFVGFAAPTINSSGAVAFDGLVGPTDGPFINGLFSEGDGVGSLRKVA